MPGLVDPCGAAGGAAVHEDFGATGEESAVAERLRGARVLLDLGEGGFSGLDGVFGAPEHAYALVELSFGEQLTVGGPGVRAADFFDGRHAFMVQVVDALEDALLAVVDGRRGNDADHGYVGLLFENTGGGTRGVAVDGACGWVFGFGGDMSEAQGVAIDGGVVSGDVL